MDEQSLDELVKRLPHGELSKIIQRALECGRQGVPFTQVEMLRALTFGEHSTFVPSPRIQRKASPRRNKSVAEADHAKTEAPRRSA